MEIIIFLSTDRSWENELFEKGHGLFVVENGNRKFILKELPDGN